MSFNHKPALTAACFFLTVNLIFPTPTHAERYIWPLDVSHVITSTFGEFREGHIHSGLDLSTGGREGLRVYAVADGYVERLRCSPFGYGKAVYVHLDDGRTAVYAHLSDFARNLADRVRTQQKAQLSYEVDVWLRPGEVAVRRGDVVGFSGSTGTSAPHLHFELRGTDGCPFNPFKVFTPPVDEVPPEISAVAIIPLRSLSRVDGLPLPKTVPVSCDESTGRYTAPEPVYIHGTVGLAIEARDKGSQGSYRRGLHSVAVMVDGKPVFSIDNDRFCYERGRQVYLAYDYSLLRRTGRRFLTTYRDVGNTLTNYHQFDSGDGSICVTDLPDESCTVTICTTDYVGNKSDVVLELRKGDPPGRPQFGEYNDFETETEPVELDCAADFLPRCAVFSIRSPGPAFDGVPEIVISGQNRSRPLDSRMPAVASSETRYDAYCELNESFNGPVTVRARARGVDGEVLSGEWTYNIQVAASGDGGRLASEDGLASVLIPPGGLYRPLYGRVNVDMRAFEPPAERVGKAYRFDPATQPLAAKSQVRIRCPEGIDTDRLGIYKYHDRLESWGFVAKYGDTASVYELGTFMLLRDNVPPSVRVLAPRADTTVTAKAFRIKIEIKDEAAGIDLGSVRTNLDGEPIICEYYPGRHTLQVTVEDNVGNESAVAMEFTIAG